MEAAYPYIYMMIGAVLTVAFGSLAFAKQASFYQRQALAKPKLAMSSTASSKTKYSPGSKDSADSDGFSGSLSMSHSQKMIDRKDGSNISSADMIASLSYHVNDNWSLNTSLGYSENLKDAEDTSNGISDLSLSTKYSGLPDFKYFSQSVTASSMVPLSKESRELDNLNSSFGLRYRIKSLRYWLIPGFSFYFSVSANRNFHTFETDKAGDVLTQYSFRQGTGASYTIGRWAFGADLSHSNRVNYEGRASEGISHSQTVSFDIAPDVWDITLGHSNQGPWFKENGEDLNLEAVSDQNSIFYVETSVSF